MPGRQRSPFGRDSEHPSEPIEIGIVGAGAVTQMNHLPVLQAVSGVRVSWIADSILERARRLVVAVDRSIRPVLARPDELPSADIVLLAIPYPSRAPYLEALQHEKAALYLEKPFALSEEERARIADMWPPNHVAVGLQKRAWGAAVMIRRIIEGEVLGPLRRISYQWGGPRMITGGRDLSSVVGPDWILWEMAIHGVDAVLHSLGDRVPEITSTEAVYDRAGLVDATIRSVALVAGKDVEIQIAASVIRPRTNRFEYEFESASVRWSFDDDELLISGPKGGSLVVRASEQEPTLATTHHQTFFTYWRDFIRSIDGEMGAYTMIETAAGITSFLEACVTDLRRAEPA